MKNETSRSASQPRPLPTRHQYEHVVPTQIHDPEQEMMVLARWTHRAMQDPTRFWGTIAAIVAGILGIVLVSNLFLASSSGRADLWSKLELAKTPAERLQVAEDNPNSPVATWARLEAATEYYNQGFADLPNNRDTALPNLKKALDQFDLVAKEAPADSPQARAAALGKARTLEARNEISKAIEEYRQVEKRWPGSPEAGQAKQLADALQKPDAAAFYKDLYAYSPAKVTLPPLGTDKFDLPLVPSPGSATPSAERNPGGLIPSIPLLPPPPPSPLSKEAPATKPSAAPATSPASAPAKPAAPRPDASSSPSTTAPTPKAEPPKAETPKPAPAPAEKPES
jgi:hypothetical protein